MVQLRHAGIYVSDMNKMVKFYTDVFNMHKICENVIQKDSLIEELLGPGSVLITKLITDYGKITGSGDMLERIYFFDAKNVEDKFIYDQSVVHICFSVENIKYVVDQLKKSSGKQCTDIHEMSNGNKCCFCKDPEGNWLELIERVR